MASTSQGESERCPRCGAATRPGDNFCANCGLGLAASRRPRTRRGYAEVFVWLGPAFGGLLGFLIGEAIVGQLSTDGPVLLPIAIIVAIGVLLGGPVLTWLVNRLRADR